jgi:DNA repair protein RecO (recombination protein O)
MLHKTRGISLHLVKYSETSIIAKVYTELFGLQSYLVRGIRRQHSKIRPGLFQPLTLLDMTVYHKEKRGIQSLKEVHNLHPYITLTTDIRKSSIALFVNELIYKSIREEEANQELFDFLFVTCVELDAVTESLGLFPLLFTIRFSKFLGIIPQVDDSTENSVFNLQDGVFQDHKPAHSYFLEPPLSLILKDLIREQTTTEHYHPTSSIQHPASSIVRNELLEQMLSYYRLHLPEFREINSHLVLHTVLA